MLIEEAVLAAFVLYWLNTRDAKADFKRSKFRTHLASGAQNVKAQQPHSHGQTGQALVHLLRLHRSAHRPSALSRRGRLAKAASVDTVG